MDTPSGQELASARSPFVSPTKSSFVPCSTVKNGLCGPGRAETPATQEEEAEDLEADMSKTKGMLWETGRRADLAGAHPQGASLGEKGHGHSVPEPQGRGGEGSSAAKKDCRLVIAEPHLCCLYESTMPTAPLSGGESVGGDRVCVHTHTYQMCCTYSAGLIHIL